MDYLAKRSDLQSVLPILHTAVAVGADVILDCAIESDEMSPIQSAGFDGVHCTRFGAISFAIYIDLPRTVDRTDFALTLKRGDKYRHDRFCELECCKRRHNLSFANQFQQFFQRVLRQAGHSRCDLEPAIGPKHDI